MDEEPTPENPAAIPRGHAKLGALSPGFVSADDVARYLHERIGSRRDVEFASVILQRLSDQLFVANEPRAGRATSFDWELLLDRDSASGEFVEPQGYRIVASLHSHPDSVRSVQQLNPTWTLQQAKAFISFYSTPDIIFNVQDRRRFTGAYLSGADGTLFKYQPSHSAAEAGFIHWLKTSGPWTSPHAHDGTLEGLYKKLAAVGRLSFLLSSPAWGGSVGQVPADWEPYKPFTAAPMQVPCGPVFADKSEALSYAWTRVQRKPTARQQVLLLQRDRPQQYIACEPLLEGASGGAETPRMPLLPGGWHLHGWYFHSRPLPGQYPDLEAWLYKHFVSPLELAKCIARFREYTLTGLASLGASVYIRMRDEAILRYRFSGSAAESQLFSQGSDGAVSDNGLQAALSGGRLLTRAFVVQVAEAGELTVEKTSALWDRAGVLDEQWKPYADVVLPRLSAAFLSADDAARFAHASIGGRRDRAFAGLLLERADGRFVVTQALPCGPRPFAFGGGYPKDRQEVPIILHPGHRLRGGYASRQALSMTDPADVARLKWTRQEAELNGQMFHDQDVADMLHSGVAGYLSGAWDSLLAYQAGESPATWRQQWMADEQGQSSLSRGLASGAIKPADVVRTLAERGTLRVVIGNGLWGPAGSIDLDWGPYVRALAYQRPERVAHGAIFANADAAAAELHARPPQDLGARHVSRWFGFILKHELKEEYVASELIPVTLKSPLLSVVGVYGERLPDGFACHGLYFSRPWVGNGPTAWLERFFASAQDLSEALAQARANASQPPSAAALYIAPPEGALLCYQSPSTTALFETQSEADTAETVQAKLDIGTLEPAQLVRLFAASGRLRVIRSSPCWDRLGSVSGAWKPYAHLQRRRLSPAFVSIDDAARYVRRRVPAVVLDHYGGIILRRDDGWFMATEPLPVPDEVFDIKWIFPDELVTRGLYPIRTSVVASYHTRPAMQWPFLLSATQAAVYSNVFSTRLLAQALAPEQTYWQHYLLAPDGALISLVARARVKYPPVTLEALVARPRHRHDWLNGTLERSLRGGELTPSEYVNRLADSFALQVVEGSPMWGEPGVVSGWSAYPMSRRDVGYLRARVDPACSPIFTQADDAARYVHGQVRRREELQFGYVLKSMHNGQFIATLATPDAGSRLAHRRVFSSAGYPYRYQLDSLYLCAPEHDDFYPAGSMQQDDSIYRGLFSPSHLIEAMYQVHARQGRSSLALYLSCADGALLKFVVRDSRFVDYADLLKLRLRLLSPGDYIRRMAAAGELRILEPSANWPGQGLVDQHWQPGRSRGASSDENYLALGPVHGHPEDAVGFSHDRVGRFVGKQYMAALLEKSAANAYVPVLPLEDTGFPSAAAERLFPGVRSSIGVSARQPQWPQGYRVSAAHLLLHAGLDQPAGSSEDDYRQYFVSWRELGFYIHQLKQRGLEISGFYLSARDGALLGYRPGFGSDEYALLATAGKWTAQAGYTALAPLPSGFIGALARIGVLRVVRAGRFWRTRMVLGEDLQLPAGSPREVPDKDEL